MHTLAILRYNFRSQDASENEIETPFYRYKLLSAPQLISLVLVNVHRTTHDALFALAIVTKVARIKTKSCSANPKEEFAHTHV